MTHHSAKGTISELNATLHFLKLGYQVFSNVTPHGIDLVIYDGKEFIAVEVKTVSKGTLTVPNEQVAKATLCVGVTPDMVVTVVPSTALISKSVNSISKQCHLASYVKYGTCERHPNYLYSND